jgi:hypothetical protein
MVPKKFLLPLGPLYDSTDWLNKWYTWKYLGSWDSKDFYWLKYKSEFVQHAHESSNGPCIVHGPGKADWLGVIPVSEHQQVGMLAGLWFILNDEGL